MTRLQSFVVIHEFKETGRFYMTNHQQYQAFTCRLSCHKDHLSGQVLIITLSQTAGSDFHGRANAWPAALLWSHTPSDGQE